MLRSRLSATIALALIFLLVTAAVSPMVLAQPIVEKAAPQGKDPPGADDQSQVSTPEEHKGVISPPPTGDKDIYTEVPNPEAGHKKEVNPPPGTSGGKPNIEPR